MKTGLTIGKFAPLHKGHQYLIEKALEEVDHLIIIVYDAPKLTQIPVDVRANWIRTIYPQTTVIEGWHVPQVEGWSEENQQKHEQFVLGLIKGAKINVFFSSEHYGERMSKTLNCENRVIDMDRNNISISATEIRINAYQYRHFLNPLVYDDFVTKVVILGDNEALKHNLMVALAHRYHTIHVDVDVNNIINLKQSAYQADRFLFINDQIFKLYVSDIAHDNLSRSDLENVIHMTNQRYDLILILEEGDVQKYISLCQQLHRVYHLVRLDQMDQISDILESYTKFA